MLLTDEMDGIQTEMTSHKHGNVEAACGMAKVGIICLHLWLSIYRDILIGQAVAASRLGFVKISHLLLSKRQNKW